jgi:hypothetical protein
MSPTPGYSIRAERTTRSRRLFTGFISLRQLAFAPRSILLLLAIHACGYSMGWNAMRVQNRRTRTHQLVECPGSGCAFSFRAGI